MEYTDEQYALMEGLEKGLNYWRLPEEQKWTLRYLQDEGIAQPRADIADGHYLLTEQGKRVLSERRRKLRSAEIETRRQLQALRDREEEKRLDRWERQRKESHEAAKIARDEAKQEKQQRFENKIAIANLLVPLITYILGIITEHYAGIMNFFLRLFD